VDGAAAPVRVGDEYRRGRTLTADEGVATVVTLLVMVVVAVAVVVLVLRAASASGQGGGAYGRRPARRPRPPGPARRPIAPDDDPDFLRDLSRRTRRDDGSPT
jgi:hypothetical protein